jgi:transposase
MSRRRSFPPDLKAQVVLEVISGARTAAEVCREHRLKPQLLSEWKARFLENAANAFQESTRLSEAQSRIADLERLVGRQALELEVAKKALSISGSLSNRSEGRR